MANSRIEYRGRFYAVRDSVFEEIALLSKQCLPEFLSTLGSSNRSDFAWFEEMMEEWQSQAPLPPGCKLIWLDEFLTSNDKAGVTINFLDYLTDRVRKTYPPGRVVTADSIKDVTDYIESVSQADKPDADAAPIEWRSST